MSMCKQFGLFLILSLMAEVAWAEQPKPVVSIKETPLGAPEAGARKDQAIFSADGRHVVWPVTQDNKWFVVLDGKPSPMYDWILLNTLTLSREGGHLAFVEQVADGLRMIVDGSPQKIYNAVSPPMFSRDGSRIAYVVKQTRESKGEQVVVDGKESPEYGRIAHRSLTFSRDGKRFAFSAERDGKCFWVIDGREGKAYEHIGPVEFSRDGARFAYAGQQAGGFVAVIDGVEAGAYEKIGAFSFSPDNRRTGFVGLRNRRMYAVIDGKEMSEFDLVFEPVFSPDSKRVLYIAGDARSACVVVDGKPRKFYDRILSVRYSGDGRRIMYLALEGRRQRVVIDEEEGKPYDLIAQMAINDDGSRWAYTAKEVDKQVMVVNGEELSGALNMTMSPGDGRFIAHAREDGNRAVMLVNGVEVGKYDAFPAGTRWVFDGPDRFYAMAVKNGELVRLEVGIQR